MASKTWREKLGDKVRIGNEYVKEFLAELLGTFILCVSITIFYFVFVVFVVLFILFCLNICVSIRADLNKFLKTTILMAKGAAHTLKKTSLWCYFETNSELSCTIGNFKFIVSALQSL